ncbi:MAG: zinc-ribbon and DUF3426 domain-containing protein [Burkholderiales bacterium]
MSMVTRCPQCNTSFRVTVQHLRARDGFVRCGRCAEIFNALTTLSALTNQSEPPALEREEIEIVPSDEFLAPREEESRPVWGTLTALAALALALQTIYFFRAGIAARFPVTAPYLHAACQYLGCSIDAAKDPRDLAIADSDLRPDPARSEVMNLSATIRNTSEHVRAYPALELTLTDPRNQPLVRRVFLPADYLKRKSNAKIAPHTDVSLELVLEIGNLNAAGYRLYLFYP